jgi:UDP-glucose 4-epimerase
LELTGPIAENSFRANTGAMLNVLSLAAERRAHLIYASSTSVYGNTGNHFSEDSAARPNNLYSTSKYVGDVLCRQQFEREALGFTSLRLSAPFGPGCRHRTVVNSFLESALRGDELSLFGSGERTQDFTYVADVVEAFRLALSRRPVGIFNIASGRPVSMKELAETIIDVTGSNSKTVFSGEPDPEENYRANLEVERARKELSWVANWSLRDGLAATAEALRAVEFGSAA